MKKLFSDIYNSFFADDKGFSGRKLSGFAAVVIGALLTYKHGSPDNADALLITWLLFALMCLGLVTFQQILQFKGVNNEN